MGFPFNVFNVEYYLGLGPLQKEGRRARAEVRKRREALKGARPGRSSLTPRLEGVLYSDTSAWTLPLVLGGGGFEVGSEGLASLASLPNQDPEGGPRGRTPPCATPPPVA
jgi:hypothetical protein